MAIQVPNLVKFQRIISNMVEDKRVTVAQVREVLANYTGGMDARSINVKFRDRTAVLGELLTIADTNVKVKRLKKAHSGGLSDGPPHGFMEWEGDRVKRIYDAYAKRWWDFSHKEYGEKVAPDSDAPALARDITKVMGENTIPPIFVNTIANYLVSRGWTNVFKVVNNVSLTAKDAGTTRNESHTEKYNNLFKVGNHITTAQWVEFAADVNARLSKLEQEVKYVKQAARGEKGD
jgi:hypothetical protein